MPEDDVSGSGAEEPSEDDLEITEEIEIPE